MTGVEILWGKANVSQAYTGISMTPSCAIRYTVPTSHGEIQLTVFSTKPSVPRQYLHHRSALQQDPTKHSRMSSLLGQRKSFTSYLAYRDENKCIKTVVITCAMLISKSYSKSRMHPLGGTWRGGGGEGVTSTCSCIHSSGNFNPLAATAGAPIPIKLRYVFASNPPIRVPIDTHSGWRGTSS